MAGTEETKLAELRAKTDGELSVLISRRLYAAVACLLEPNTAGGSVRAAQEAYGEAAALMPRIHDLPAAKRKQLEARLAKLRALLDEAETEPEVRAFAAC